MIVSHLLLILHKNYSFKSPPPPQNSVATKNLVATEAYKINEPFQLPVTFFIDKFVPSGISEIVSQ